MPNITKQYWLPLGPTDAGRTDIAYAIEGSSFTTSGVSESSTVAGNYSITITHDSGLNSCINWRAPISGGGNEYFFEAITPANSLADKTGLSLASTGLDQITVEPAVAGGTAVSLIGSLRMLLSRAWGNWTQDPTTKLATYQAAGNPTVTRGTIAPSTYSRDTTISP